MDCEIEKQVPSPKAGARMRRAESGMGLGAEVLMRTLLGGVEVRVALSATGAPESHSASRIVGRTTRGHPFLNASCPGRQMIEKADRCRNRWRVQSP